MEIEGLYKHTKRKAAHYINTLDDDNYTVSRSVIELN